MGVRGEMTSAPPPPKDVVEARFMNLAVQS